MLNLEGAKVQRILKKTGAFEEDVVKNEEV
jgi:hypothetical protein